MVEEEQEETQKKSTLDTDKATWRTMDWVQDFEELSKKHKEHALFTNGIIRKQRHNRYYQPLSPMNKRVFIVARYILYAIIDHYEDIGEAPNKKELFQRVKKYREVYGERIKHKLRNTPVQIERVREDLEEAEYKLTHAKVLHRDINESMIMLIDVVDVIHKPLKGNLGRTRIYYLTEMGERIRELVRAGYCF